MALVFCAFESCNVWFILQFVIISVLPWASFILFLPTVLQEFHVDDSMLHT